MDLGHFEEGPVTVDAGIVDEDGDGTEVAEDLLDGFAHLLGGTNVGLIGPAPHAFLVNRLGQLSAWSLEC